jgi:hypothetical protein
MSKPQKPVGQVVIDEHGSRTWVWRGDEGVDTAQVRALGEGLSLDNTPPGGAPLALDPYNQIPVPGKAPKRRTLDDMRQLNEQIKKAKCWKRED